jgi:hypothetical protein
VRERADVVAAELRLLLAVLLWSCRLPFRDACAELSVCMN